jgi:hypothetical protein
VPSADIQQYAVLWMKGYFDRYGDNSPNSDETKLCIMNKSDVYKKYKDEHVEYYLEYIKEYREKTKTFRNEKIHCSCGVSSESSMLLS